MYPTLTERKVGSIIVLFDVRKLLLLSSKMGEANCAKNECDLWSLSLQPGYCFLRIYIIVKDNVLIRSYCVGATGLCSHGKILSSYIGKSNWKTMFVFYGYRDCWFWTTFHWTRKVKKRSEFPNPEKLLLPPKNNTKVTEILRIYF